MLALCHRFSSCNNGYEDQDHNYSGLLLDMQNEIDFCAVKKLNHNANERHRRKKINQLYSSLRTLLPASDRMKKVSIPATVSLALKYIPELQRQVEGLIRERDKLFSIINSRQQVNLQVKQKTGNDMKFTTPLPICSISANQLSSNEIAVQISSPKENKNSLSHILLNLEQIELSVVSASSFESARGRVFHNLQFQVEGSRGMEYCGTIRDKLMSLYHNKEMLPRGSIVPEKLYK